MTDQPKPPMPPRPSPPDQPRLLDAAALFGTGREVQIRHGTELYRLRITQAGKLILTK